MTSYLRIALPWLLIIAIAAIATWIRYGFIEPAEIGHICESGVKLWWCSLRQDLIFGFLNNSYGYVALAAAVSALIWRHPLTATASAALGLFALQLYCFEAGALAMLIGVLRLVRLQVTPTQSPGDQHGYGDQHIQPRP